MQKVENNIRCVRPGSILRELQSVVKTCSSKQTTKMAFAEWAQHNTGMLSFNNVWFSDEAHIHLDCVVSEQNVRFWASQNPCEIQ
jgi:hypothetical protein